MNSVKEFIAFNLAVYLSACISDNSRVLVIVNAVITKCTQPILKRY